jgi:hypothetical protein
MLQKNVSRKRSCFAVKPLYRCLMVRRESSDPLIEQTYEEDAVVPAHWFDVRDEGLELESARVAIKAGTTIYLAASQFSLWYYIVSWVDAAQRYVCSCREAKQLGRCSHVEQVVQIRDTVV